MTRISPCLRRATDNNMTTTRELLIYRTETADEYGRREKCLKNHRRAPFCFESCIPYLQSTVQQTDGDMLISQPGLRAITLPQPHIFDETFDLDQIKEVKLEEFLEDSPLQIPPLIAGHSLRDLFITAEPLDLGPCPEADVQEYLKLVSRKRYSNPFDQWLPLSSVRVDRDEGLPFPPKTDRLQSLLQRELERETLTLSDDASIFEQEVSRSPLTSQDKQFLLKFTKPEASYYSHPEPITPPLSPVSDYPSPFVPNNDSTIIDLTSEPSSPTSKEVQLLQEGCLDSEPIVPSTLPTSSPSQGLPECTEGPYASIQDSKVEIPVILASSDTVCEENALANIYLSSITNDEGTIDPQHEQETYFGDAFTALLDDRRSYAENLVGQERLNPTDSVSRVPVPILTFEIPQPEWSNCCSSAKTHFAWLMNSSQERFNTPIMPRDTRSESVLKWTPIPPNSGRIIVSEELQLLSQSSRNCLTMDEIPTVSSASFVSVPEGLAILEPPQDEEIEDSEPLTDDNTSQTPPLAETEHQIGPNNQGSMSEVKSCYFKTQDWPSLIRPLRRKVIDASMGVLPKSHDTSATSKLLSGFMELRAAKKPRINSSSTRVSRTMTTIAPSHQLQDSTLTPADQRPPSLEAAQKMIPAAAPEIEIPPEKGTFIVSLGLGRLILRHLETIWPPENLVDIAYSRQTTMAWPPDAAQPKERVSTLTFEADISLSPSAGVIVTNLLKVKQRSLPGSKALTPLRERVQKVSQKYETLIVLVSESNPAGEFAGTLASSDVAAYADFVRFAVALDADVNVLYVPGAEGTLAKWIASFLCRYSHQSATLKRFLSAEETTWEIFLRRAGMNIVAAKVLSKTLFEQAGPSGLARFLVTPAHERISKYRQLLGGDKVLRISGELLDREWA